MTTSCDRRSAQRHSGMTCRQCRATVSAMLDGEASRAETRLAEAHLVRCQTCRSAARRAATITRRLRTRPAEPCPDLVDAVLARLMRANSPEPAARGSAAPEHRPRLACVPEQRPVWLVGDAACGCAHDCACGCQQGGTCRCGSKVA